VVQKRATVAWRERAALAQLVVAGVAVFAS
jgi:hypothetical protein